MVTASKTLQADRELDIARADNVLDLKVREFPDEACQRSASADELSQGTYALKPSFWMMRAYLRLASLLSSSDFAPVTTILPEAKMSAVVLGSRMRMMTAAKRLGLYSALRA